MVHRPMQSGGEQGSTQSGQNVGVLLDIAALALQ